MANSGYASAIARSLSCGHPCRFLGDSLAPGYCLTQNCPPLLVLPSSPLPLHSSPRLIPHVSTPYQAFLLHSSSLASEWRDGPAPFDTEWSNLEAIPRKNQREWLCFACDSFQNCGFQWVPLCAWIRRHSHSWVPPVTSQMEPSYKYGSHGNGNANSCKINTLNVHLL